MIPKQLTNSKFCRVRYKTKKPFEKDWTNKLYSYDEISKFKDENYGILCGHNNLAVIDCDVEEFKIAIENMLPETFTVQTGSGGHHFYFIIPELKQKIILELSTGTHLGEVQSYGTQVVGAGSVHPNGKKYQVIKDIPITEISCEKLFEVIKPFMKEVKQTEDNLIFERKESSDIDNLNITDIWSVAGMKNLNDEYYGTHPIHGSEGGMNFWINPSKNMWHCFRCNSGGGPLSAIAVKEGIINCSEARAGSLRGDKAFESIKIAKEKYGLKDNFIKETVKKAEANQNDIKIIWDDELKDFKIEEKDWVIDKLIPSNSVCILTGKRGTLKTFIALNMGYCIASGDSFLKHFDVEKGKVIYLDKENGLNIMKKRTQMLKKGLELKGDLGIGFICFSQLKIDRMGDMMLIEKAINKYKPKLLIIDTYRRGISFDENDAGKVSELFVDTLRPLVEKYNVSIILIHHNRKSGQGSGDEMDELRGSSDLANYADIILKMERRGENLILKQLKNRNAEEEKPIKIKSEFNEDYVKLIYEGEFLRQSKADKCVELLSIWIAEEDIKQFKTAAAKAIAFKGGVKESTFKSAIEILQDSGVIENIGFGLYNVI